MRKLFLTSFRFTTGENDYTEYRIVAVNSKNDEQSDLESVYRITQFWFKATFPESKLLSLQAHPTIAEQVETDDVEILKQSLSASERFRAEDAFKSLVDVGKRFYSINDHEGIEEEYLDGESVGYTKDVLIDIDGNKKNFRVGWFDTDDHEWRLYSEGDTIDMKHAVYTKLDF